MADTYSFDVVSDFDRQELVNTLDQVRRDVGQRFDLKDSGTEIDLEETSLTITTASDMTLQAVEDVLRQKATKRNLSLKIFDFQTPEAVGGNKVKQVVKLRKGLSQELIGEAPSPMWWVAPPPATLSCARCSPCSRAARGIRPLPRSNPSWESLQASPSRRVWLMGCAWAPPWPPMP